jgi:hypothetical protein
VDTHAVVEKAVHALTRHAAASGQRPSASRHKVAVPA